MVPMAHLGPAHLVGSGKIREEERRRIKGEETKREKKRRFHSLKPAAGAARFWVLILQINLDPHVFSHMAQN